MEIEAGAGHANNRCVFDVIKAAMSDDVNHLVVSALLKYRDTTNDYELVRKFIEQMFEKNILGKPESVLLIGY